MKTMNGRTSTFVVLAVTMSFLLCLGSSHVFAKKQLSIRGNVIAYNLLGRMVTMHARNVLLVKVERIYKGKEKAGYISVVFWGIDPAYVPSNFGFEKPLEFQLKRTPDCDRAYGRLKIFEVPDETGVVFERLPSLTFLPGVDEGFLPDDTRVPCYSIVR